MPQALFLGFCISFLLYVLPLCMPTKRHLFWYSLIPLFCTLYILFIMPANPSDDEWGLRADVLNLLLVYLWWGIFVRYIILRFGKKHFSKFSEISILLLYYFLPLLVLFLPFLLIYFLILIIDLII